MSNYASKVAAGIKLLDEKKPGWRSLVDVESLRLENCDVCVLGQVFGHYDTGKAKLGIDNYESKALGFNTDYSFSELNEAWKEALGANQSLVEKGDVYKDAYGYAVEVIATSLVKLDDKTTTVYVVLSGEVRGGVFKPYDNTNPSLLRRTDFGEGASYPTKVDKFVPKKGMFVTNAAGQHFFMISDKEVRELVDGAYSQWLDNIDRKGLREMVTGLGVTFSESLVQ